jgi:hypothetical protein
MGSRCRFGNRDDDIVLQKMISSPPFLMRDCGCPGGAIIQIVNFLLSHFDILNGKFAKEESMEQRITNGIGYITGAWPLDPLKSTLILFSNIRFLIS